MNDARTDFPLPPEPWSHSNCRPLIGSSHRVNSKFCKIHSQPSDTMKLWVVAIAGANVPILGPSAKTAPSRKAVLFNGQILAEAETGLIRTDQT